MLKWVADQGVTLAVCESTGGYERGLVCRLRTSEVGLHVAHPNKVRAFAKACGQDAKTDGLDAQVQSRYGELFDVLATSAQAEESLVLRDLLTRRQQLMGQRVQEFAVHSSYLYTFLTKSSFLHPFPSSFLHPSPSSFLHPFPSSFRRMPESSK